MVKASASKSRRQSKGTEDPVAESSGPDLPWTMPVRQRRRSSMRPPATDAPNSTAGPAVTASDGPPHAGPERDRPAENDDRGQGSAESEEAPAYTVGYGRPPKHTQFKKGQSGNPAGRPRESKNTETFYMQERNAPIEITEIGRRKKAPKIAVILKKTFNDALSGKPKAIDTILKLESLYGTEHSSSGASGTEPQDVGWQDERDREVFDHFLANHRAMVLAEVTGKGADAAAEVETATDAEAEAEAETATDAQAKAEADAGSSNSNAASGSGGADSNETPNEGADKLAGTSTADDGAKADDEPVVTFDRPLRSFRNGEWTEV